MAITEAQSLAIERRIYELLDDGYGELRTVPSDRVSEAFLGNEAADEAMDSAVKPRIEVIDAGWRPASSRPMAVDGPNDVEEYEFRIRATYSLPASELGPRDPRRLAARAAARRDCSLFKAALEHPPNMLEDSEGNATGIIAGMVEALSATPREDVASELLIYEHRYRCTVMTDEAI